MGNKEDLHALILSGGGADGAYQIGVARALFNGMASSTYGQSLDPDVFTGTSIGSFNASFLVSQWEDYGAAAVSNLEKVWLERIASGESGGGGYRLRLNPLELLDPRSYLKDRLVPVTHFLTDVGVLGREFFNRSYNLLDVNGNPEPFLKRLSDFFNLSSFIAVEPWKETIRESIDFKKIRDSRKLLVIAATNWAFGEVREFRNREMTDKLGPAAIQASSAVPGVLPPAQVGAQSYVDGAVLMNTPLSPAIKGLRKVLESSEASDQEPDFVLHCVYMNTEVERMPLEALESTLQTLYRTQIISWASAVNQDIRRARNLNEGLGITRKEHEGVLTGEQLRVFLETSEQLLKALESGRRYKKLTIHRYYPPDGLDGALGFLDARRDRLERLIEQGFDDTVNHDCRINKCVLAGKHKALRRSEP